MVELRNIYKVSFRKPEGKYNIIYKDNIKMDLKKMLLGLVLSPIHRLSG
jgi:hypothetical protein